MPEGPEIRHNADLLWEALQGRRIVNAYPERGGRYATVPPVGHDGLAGALEDDALFVNHVGCKGKFMWWELAPPVPIGRAWYVWITHGMSGRWSHGPGVPHAAYGFDHAGLAGPPRELHFCDPRRFGTLRFTASADELRVKLDSLGPDMLVDPPDVGFFAERLMAKPKRTLAEALMDQGCVSGVGNYVKAEALYASRLSPHRTVGSLGSADMEALRDAVVSVMKGAYAARGATLRSYRDPADRAGSAQFAFQAYGRRADPAGNPVVRELTLDGRTTHWCPAVQS